MTADMPDPVPFEFTYRNWRGETSNRRVIPLRVWFGSTEWHPEPQWFLNANDLDKGETRDFAMRDIGARAMQDAMAGGAVRTLTVFDWAHHEAGRLLYAGTPERAERLAREGVKLTPVYTIDEAAALEPATATAQNVAASSPESACRGEYSEQDSSLCTGMLESAPTPAPEPGSVEGLADLKERLRSEGAHIRDKHRHVKAFYAMEEAADALTTLQQQLAARDARIAEQAEEISRLTDEADGEFANAAMRVMQANPGFDWHDYVEGITADDFEQFFAEDMNEAWRCYEREKARATAAEAECAKLREAEDRAAEARDAAGYLGTVPDCIRHLAAALAQAMRDIKRKDDALRRADQFITNGIEFGFIRMPDASTPDPARETPGIIRDALAAKSAGGGE